MSILKKIIPQLFSQHSDHFNKQDIEAILDKDNEFDRDITISTGAHLELSNLRLVGKKSQDPNDKFKYEKKFYPGINILISDNLKGKSTILKSIKFALSGRNRMKKDVSSWIDYIFLEFKVGNVSYTSVIDKSGSRIKAQLYRTTISAYDAQETRDVDLIFGASSLDELESLFEKFFYAKLGVSSLRWTQKDSRKNINKLNEAGTSWVTFFKTIYLESKDSSTLIFGNQGELLIQILLGLGLTSSMNKLKIKKELLEFESSLEINNNEKPKDYEKLALEINSDIKSAEANLSDLRNSEENSDISSMINQKSLLILKVEKIEGNKINDIRKNAKIQEKLANLVNKKHHLESEQVKLEEQEEKNQKRFLQIDEHIELGSFFSNLEIKSCPSCNNNLTNTKTILTEHKNCNLCHHEVTDTERKEDVSRLESKKYELKDEIEKIKIQISVIKSTKKDLESNIEEAENNNRLIDLSLYENKISELLSLIKKLEENINSIRSSEVNLQNDIRSIENKIAVLAYRHNEAEKLKIKASQNCQTNDPTHIISLFEDAIALLENLRAVDNESIIREFKEIILRVLRSLGLESFTDIEIDSKLKIKYVQGGNKLSYSDITEGEQLRVKISLYLALVQLNSEHGVGNHPRILMIDSPGKEEADNKYFDGFIDALNTIENNFSDKIQILIGSADRRLCDIVSAEKQEIIEEGKAIF